MALHSVVAPAILVIIATACFSYFVPFGKWMVQNSQDNIATRNLQTEYLSVHGLLISDSAGQNLLTIPSSF